MSQILAVPLLRLPHGEGLPAPRYMTVGASGVDLYAAVQGDTMLAPMAPAAIPTGVCLALPEGTEGQIRPRSGLALTHAITCLNTPGTIDSDYRGEIQVILMNLGKTPFVIHRGDRIAQLVIAPVLRVYWEEVSSLEETERGERRFGSSGV